MLPNASLNDHSALLHTPTIADPTDSKFVEKISVEIVKMENLKAMFGATFVLTFFFFLLVYYSILRWVIKVRINFGSFQTFLKNDPFLGWSVDPKVPTIMQL